MLDKYLDVRSLEIFFLGPNIPCKRASMIWRSISKCREIITIRMMWKFDNGRRIPIQCSNIMGVKAATNIDPDFFHRLAHSRLILLYDLITDFKVGIPLWMSFEASGLLEVDRENWQTLISSLQAAGLCLDPLGDRFVWGGTHKESNICVKDLYFHIKSEGHTVTGSPGSYRMWKWKIPHKIVLFIWLIRRDKILT